MNLLRRIVWIAPIALLLACASGPAFHAVTDAPSDKAVIYVYRPSGIVGAAVGYTVYAGSEPLAYLKPGGYYAYVAEPKATEISAKAEARSAITLDLLPGQSYYVKGEVGVGIVAGRPKLTLMDPATGARE